MNQDASIRKPPSRAAVHQIGQEIENVIGELSNVADTLRHAVTLREQVRAIEDAIDGLRDIRGVLVNLIVALRILRGDGEKAAAK